MLVYKDFIHPDNIRYYDEGMDLIGIASRIWVSKMMDAGFIELGYNVVNKPHE